MLPYAQPRTLGHLLERDVDPRRGQNDDLVCRRPLKRQPPEGEPARGLDCLDEDGPLRAVAPSEDTAAARPKIELRHGPEPSGDLLRLGYGRHTSSSEAGSTTSRSTASMVTPRLAFIRATERATRQLRVTVLLCNPTVALYHM